MKLSIMTALIKPMIAFIVLCSWLVSCSLAKENQTAVLEDIGKYDTCVYKSTFSYSNPEYYPPTSVAGLKTMCRTQSEGFKCLKERTRGATPLIRRGLVAIAGTRQRQHKKVCTNTESERSKKLVAGGKCLEEKSVEKLVRIDTELRQKATEILRRNYNDSKPELQHFCCMLFEFKRDFIAIAKEDCPGHESSVEEIMGAIITSDITLICEEDEKLEKLCPTLDKLILRGDPKTLRSGVNLFLYLASTLGEADENLPQFN